jgi:hypothetical protein
MASIVPIVIGCIDYLAYGTLFMGAMFCPKIKLDVFFFARKAADDRWDGGGGGLKGRIHIQFQHTHLVAIGSNRCHWSGFKLFFFHHGGAMAWRGWPSVFQDSVKNMAPCWRMKSPNVFCDFLATVCHRPPTYILQNQNTLLPLSPPPATAAAVVVFVITAITVIVPSAVPVAAVVLVSLPPQPPRLPLPLLAFS